MGGNSTEGLLGEVLQNVTSAVWLVNNWWIMAVGGLLFAVVNIAAIFRRKARKPWLDPSNFQPLTLTEKRYITHNTLRLKFALPDVDQRLGLPIGQHITFLAKDGDGKDVYRPYTPTTDDDLLGAVEFVIKIYPQGKMSQILARLQVGQPLLMKGPKGRFQYTPNMVNYLGMLAGGTGITPMFQVVNAILKNSADRTVVSLVYGSLSEQDILLRQELDDLARMHPMRLKVHHVLNDAPPAWDGSVGFITPAIISRYLPAPGPGTLVLRCGPLPMMNAMKDALDGLGYTDAMQFQF